jgi:hypothetical protein
VHRVELRGGLNTAWLIDGRVHRPAGPWSSTVHALLRHVSAAGFGAAPVPFGFDSEGREVLSYVPGEVGHHSPTSDEAVVSAARLLRRFTTPRSASSAAGISPGASSQGPPDLGATLCPA